MDEMFIVLRCMERDGDEVMSVWSSEEKANEEMDRIARLVDDDGEAWYSNDELYIESAYLDEPYTSLILNDPEISSNG